MIRRQLKGCAFNLDHTHYSRLCGLHISKYLILAVKNVCKNGRVLIIKMPVVTCNIKILGPV